ncbi:MAG: PilZ domain-containing protein [Gammaproteobacteria bacterium]
MGRDSEDSMVEDDKDTPDRRDYFRIDDQVRLNLRPVSEAEVAELRERILGRVPDRFTIAAHFAVSSRATARLLHGLASGAPDAARYMRLMDQKLNQLARLFVLEEVERGEFPRLDVNLSAGGLVFPSPHAFTVDDRLALRMVLYPDMVGILTVAEVVHCDRLANPPDALPWQVGVEYLHIRESDRDLLVSHIMARETEQLRRQRGEED